ncbi:MAG: TIGR02996 domain-containing protein [Gemmataceae bacterium]|nr:TIGR02996 domain-containing protein [Gemmataceae bacterium]
MLERSFLDSIQADPNDELARLAYADWLEERSDPRADFLRAEAAFFRTGPSPSFLRVSELASGIGLDWLAEASLMAVALRAAWGRVGKGFRCTARVEPGRAWEESETRLSELFGGKGFVVPYDYSLFQTLFPGGWFREGGRGVECALWAGEMVRQRTQDWYEDIEGPPWLSFGAPYSDHEELFLCCSAADPLFGHVALGGDDLHILQYHMGAGLAPSFLHYLRSL